MSSPDGFLPDAIADGEAFTRFLLSKSHFAREKSRVKPQAFMPNPNPTHGRLETSVHRIARLTQEQIWQLGYGHVEKAEEGRIIKARAVGAFELVTATGLSCDVNGPPYPRHVDIVGWSDEKHVRLMRATEIADNVTLELDPRP